jgi:hypothetical protein
VRRASFVGLSQEQFASSLSALRSVLPVRSLSAEQAAVEPGPGAEEPERAAEVPEREAEEPEREAG